MNFPILPELTEIQRIERQGLLKGMLDLTAHDMVSCLRDGSSRGILWADGHAMQVIARGSTPEEQLALKNYFSEKVNSCLGSSSTLSGYCAYRAMLFGEQKKPYTDN